MQIGLGIGIPFTKSQVWLAVQVVFTPAKLFDSGANGLWLDPSDLTTMFQDSAGTTPVTAVEQPVGLLLDKSKGGVGTNGTKRVNLLTKTEDFSNNIWGKFNPPIVEANNDVSPDNTITANRVTAQSETKSTIYTQYVINGGVSATHSIYAKMGTARYLYLEPTSVSPTVWFDLQAGTVASNISGGQASITSLGSGWYRCSVSIASSSNTFSFGFSNTSGASSQTVGAYSWAWGADLRLASEANTLPLYQKITDTWYNTIPGNHAFQSTSANRPTLSARYNLLEKTEDLSNAYWPQTGFSSRTVSGAFTTLTENTANSVHTVSKAPVLTLQANTTPITIQAIFKAGTRRYFQFQVDNATVAVGCVVDTQNWTATALTGSGVITASSITPIGGGEYSVSVTGYFNSGTAVCNLVIYGLPSAVQNNISYLGNGSTIIVGKVSLVPASQSSLPYQRVNTATDYDSAATKFPWYLKFNGTSSSLQTASINFTATDKMFVSAGFRQLTESQQGIVGTDPGSSSGAFLLYAEAAGTTLYLNKTNAAYAKVSKPTPPYSRVTAHALDLAGLTYETKYPVVRVDGAFASVSYAGTNTGTGNFANAPLKLGSYAGGNFFNGNLYQLVIAGKQASTEEIDSTENYIELKTFGKDMSYVYDYLVDSTGNQITDSAGNPIYVTATYQ